MAACCAMVRVSCFMIIFSHSWGEVTPHDEAPEFPRAVLDTLRQPLERGQVTISRASGASTFPCRAQLVLAANPCPCASAAGDAACTCSPVERRRYQSRLSGPLLDRIDLRVDLPAVTRAAWLEAGT